MSEWIMEIYKNDVYVHHVIRCPKCGHRYLDSDDFNYCPNCGKQHRQRDDKTE